MNLKALRRSACLIPAFVALYTPVQAQDEDVETTAARYGSRGSVLQISMSPSGNKIAFIAPRGGHGEAVNVVDLANGGKVAIVSGNTEQNADITRCDWTSDTRLVCQIRAIAARSDGLLLPYTRTFAIDDDGENGVELSQRRSMRALGFRQDGGDVIALDVKGREDTILFTREYIPERTIGTRLANEEDGLGVDMVDARDGKVRTYERPDSDAIHYIADENGELRIKYRALTDMSGYLTGEREYMYRPAGKGSWEMLRKVTIDGKARPGFVPTAVDAKREVIYGYDRIGGFDAIVEVPLSGSGEGRVVMARDDVDVDALIRIGRQRRVVGATYATEKRAIQYFDPALQQLADSFRQALPDQPLINIVGASADENRLLIVASSDTDPGMSYLFDRTTNRLEPLLPIRELLADRPMGRMQPVEYKAADGTMIPGYLTLPPGSDGRNLPTIVLPHGGPAARDEWGFDWLPQFLVARGYAVLQPNYRGSAGYGEDWYGRNGYQAWDRAIGDVNDAGRWLISEGIADPDKIAIVGWSYGGYAALQSQVVDADLYKAVVAIAPVSDLEYLRGDARKYTHFELRDRQLGRGPHIAAGSPRLHAEKFVAPVALFHPEDDLNVDVRHSRGMAKALEDAGKTVQYTEFEGLQHDIADSRVRMQMLASIDRFLSSALDD